MGLFGGLIGGLLGGGGSTKVNQTSTNTTKVDVGVDVKNSIDLSALGDALDKFGTNTTALIKQLGDGTNGILSAMLASEEKDQKLRQAQLVLTLNGQAIETDRTAVFKKFGNAILWAGGSYLVYKAVK